MEMRTQIWNSLLDSKFQSCYIDLLLDKYQSIEWRINVGLALASSGSIATWVVWDMYPTIWGSIIATSQVISVIKPYFPFSNYIVQLRDKSPLMKQLNYDYEKLWYDMEYNKITEDESVKAHFDLKKRKSDILNFKSQHKIFTDNKIEQKVIEIMKHYEKNNFGIERD